MITAKLEAKNHFLKIYPVPCYQVTAEVWKVKTNVPIFSENFKQSTPIQDIISWGNKITNFKDE